MTSSPPPDGRPANLREVAALAGVSLATASRVLSGNHPIATDTRSRVISAMRELGYSESRARRREATRTIGVVVSDVRSSLISSVTAGIDAAAVEAGRLSMIVPTEGDVDRERDVVRLMAQHRDLDALIFVGGAYHSADYDERLDEYLAKLGPSDARLIVCARPGVPVPPGVLSVSYDNEGGAYALASHLLARGHRRIAWVGGSSDYSTTEGRVRGVTRALDDHGLEPVAVVTTPSGAVGTRRARREHPAYLETMNLLDRHPEVTAIIAYSDFHAVEVVRALRDRGVSVPDQVSVVGFDDDPVAQQVRPSLTTVHLPMFDLGWEAARMAIEKPIPGMPGSSIELGTHVVIRESVVPPRS
jgi:LacI family transcriptional regulator